MQNTANQTVNSTGMDSNFLKTSKPIDAAFALAEWASWKFLAITTAVMAYGLFDSFLSGKLDGTALIAARTAGIFLFYLMVDHGLSSTIRYLIRERRKVDGNPAKKVFLNFLVLLIIFRVVATATTSIWAAPEVANVITEEGREREYLAEIGERDSLKTVREATTLSYLEKLEKTEKERVRVAEKQGAALVAAAINSGNRWQRDSYKKEGFGWLNNPSNRDASDREYSRRIKAAQARAADLVAAEQSRTTEARQTFASAKQDTTGERIANLLATMAERERADYESTISRRTAYVWIFDIVAVFLGLFMSYIRTQRKIAGGEPEPEKNLLFTLSVAVAKWQLDFLNWLESLLGVDINGDGTVGGVQYVVSTVSNSAETAPKQHKQLRNNEEGIGFTAIRSRAEPTVSNSRETTETTVSNSAQTAVQTPPLPPVFRQPETVKQVVIQATQTETAPEKTTVSNSRETTRETVVLKSPEVDVSEWKNRARIYHKRSIKTTSEEATRKANREKFDEYRELLTTAGWVTRETPDGLEFTRA